MIGNLSIIKYISVSRYLFYISQNYSFAILRPLQEAILNRGGKVKWFVEGAAVNLSYFKKDEERLKTVEDIFAFNAIATLYPANIAPTFLPGINVAIFHGFDAGKVDKSGKNDHIKMRNCFDLYCTQGPIYTSGFNQLIEHKKHYLVKETGWCALDPMFNKNTVNKVKTKPTILFCSTFTKKLSSASKLYQTIKQLSEQGKWNWMVQFHPKMPTEIVEQYKRIENDNLSFVETDDVTPLLIEADVMVCDTSSVLLMFLLLEKPVVTFNNISPKDFLLNIESPELLESTIKQALLKPKKLMDNISTFITQNHPYKDAKSSERVLNAIDEVLEQSDKLAQKPIDLIRQFKMRKKLNYWSFW